MLGVAICLNKFSQDFLMRCSCNFHESSLIGLFKDDKKKYVEGDDDDNYNYNYHDYHFWLLQIKSVMLIKTAL